MEQNIKKIALLSGGGDCPGLNAVIRTITKTAIENTAGKSLVMSMAIVVFIIIIT
jgi:6-phosphofructokinase